MPGRIFISYSKTDPEPTRALADFLTSQGYSVWWDTNLTSGEVFREVIDRELAAADAVIVIWTAHSVASNWVISEADDAARRNKLITVRTNDMEPWRIPKPYNTYQADIVDNRDAVLAAVRRLAGETPKPEAKQAPNLSEATLHEALALEHWQAIKTSADPAKLRSFLNEFGGTKCAPLARAELERLAECEWRKLRSSNDIRALHSFRLLFSQTMPGQLAYARIEALASNLRSSQFPADGPQKSGIWGFWERNAVAIAVAWLCTIVPFAIYCPSIFDRRNWAFILFSSPDRSVFSGSCFGLLLVSITVLALLTQKKAPLQPIEAAIYWFGSALSLGLFVWLSWILLYGPDLLGIDPAPGSTGFAAGLIVLIGSGLAARRLWKASRGSSFTDRAPYNAPERTP